VSFNYDQLLDQACASVFGLHLHDMDAYISRPDVHVHKPHGAVNWAQPADWPSGRIGDGKDGARVAMCDDAANVVPRPHDPVIHAPTSPVQQIGPGSAAVT
jgi:hypothetical protein